MEPIAHRELLQPLVAQVLLTLAVWIWLYVTRLGTLWKQRVNPQVLADEARSQEILKEVVNPSDNFENLFELPVLFYAAVFAIIVSGASDRWYVGAAWMFVAFRAIHSLIHCTSNRIMYRFAAYLLSSFALWAIWIRFGIELFSGGENS